VQESQRLDPDFCRVHYQFAFIYVQQARYREMEGELVESILCPTTGVQAMDLWNKYWASVIPTDPSAEVRKSMLSNMVYERQRKNDEAKQQQRSQSNRDEL
jgi:hypothetical protein